MKTDTRKTDIRVLSKTQGDILGIAGGNYRIIISGKETGEAYAVIEMHVPPGGGPPPHAHPGIQEMFYVMEGELEFKTEDGKSMVKEGGFINIPFGGAVHCFKNISGKVARMLCTVIPAGLENAFREIGAPALPGQFLPIPENTPGRKALMKKIDEKYGQKIYPPDYLD